MFRGASAGLFQSRRVEIVRADHQGKLPANGERRNRREVPQDGFNGESVVRFVFGENQKAVRVAGENTAAADPVNGFFSGGVPLGEVRAESDSCAGFRRQPFKRV